MRKKTKKKNPNWKYGICLKPGKINLIHKNGKPYYFPVS